MQAARRNCFLRLAVVVARLRSGAAVNATTLAVECGVCRKTIHRDLEFLRDAGFRLEFDPAQHRWRWDEAGPKPWWLGGTLTQVAHPLKSGAGRVRSSAFRRSPRRAA